MRLLGAKVNPVKSGTATLKDAVSETLIPAIESAHAIAYLRKVARTLPKDFLVVVTLSGRGDKDCAGIARYRAKSNMSE